MDSVRVLIRYDVENVSDETFEKACNGIFSEPPVDTLYKEEFPAEEGSRIFSVEFLPGQFDQRADSAAQCIQLISMGRKPEVKFARVIALYGAISEEDGDVIRKYCINPVDSQEASMEKPETIAMVTDIPEDVKTVEGFRGMDDTALEAYRQLGVHVAAAIKIVVLTVDPEMIVFGAR